MNHDSSTLSRVLGSLNVGVCVWELTRPGDPSSLVLRICTEAAARFLSVERAAVVGLPIGEGFPGSLSTPLPGVFTRVIESGEPAALGDVPYRDEIVPDGMFSVVVHAVGARCAAVEFTNVTEARQAQTDAQMQLEAATAARRELIQSEKMASLGLLMAGVAHELKNPLNFVNNFSDLAIEYVDELRERKEAGEDISVESVESTLALVAQNLLRVREHGRRADEIINVMLMHSRERQSMASHVALNDVVAESVELAHQAFRGVHCDFVMIVEEALDASVGELCLPAQEIGRVVVNLVSNACYAMLQRQRGDRPLDYEPRLIVRTARHAHDVELLIRDNGVGMSNEVRRRVFDPFYTTKPPGEGTGLGLSLGYEVIVKELGGTIKIRSEPGRGTDLSVRIPVLDREEVL